MGDRWRAVAALVDRSRRALYLYVRRQDHPVSRDEAARAHRLSRNLAAFHLDKLVDAGLLRARYQAPPERPRGRGRAPKVYEPAGDDLAVTIPERRYQLVAEILADAVAGQPAPAVAGQPAPPEAQPPPEAAGDAVRRHARRHGHELGARMVDEDAELATVLRGLGFEPHRDAPGRTVLRNCPFRAVAERHTELICGMNHAFLGGLVDGLAITGVQVRLAPRPPACCVEIIDTS